ncbi:hypothetical protein [Marinicellulosiphila megalodicopiae]|uniref:hypothetical protein n=1 Tax=Marinicellulosiphila megalodicopiae TaxID=2724896 RepID=UPI003BB1F0FB
MVRQIKMQYKNSSSPEILKQMSLCAQFISKHAPELIELEGDSKWTQGNLLFRFPEDEQGFYAFMLGALASKKVSLHIMPLYGIEHFRVKYEQAFKPFISGKSCIQFSKFNDLPQKALLDVVKNGTKQFKSVMQAQRNKKSTNR